MSKKIFLVNKKSVCIYCASSRSVPEIYFSEAEKLALALVKNNCSIIYGGGAVGLMGKIADTAMDAGGEVIGIIPRFMVEVEWGHTNITRLITVEDMPQRKNLLMNKADAIVALPGGTGTLEELIEVISLKRLELFNKPIIILNTNGYYNELVSFMQKMVDQKFLESRHLEIYTIINDADEVVPAIMAQLN